MLEGIHAGYGDILIVVLISDDPHHLVVISIIQESHVFTEAQVSYNNNEEVGTCVVGLLSDEKMQLAKRSLNN